MTGSLIKNFGLVAGASGRLNVATHGLAGLLAKVGVVALVVKTAWDILGEGHLNATGNIDVTSGALERETVAAYNAAVAAGKATTEVDALAIAHVALSQAIAASADEDLSADMAVLNVESSEWLDTLLGLGKVVPDLDSLNMQVQLAADYFGIGADEATIWIDQLRYGGATVEQLANILGVTVPEVEAFLTALADVTTYAIENKHEVDALARSYLDAQVALGGTAKQAVLAAQEIAGNRQEAGNAVAVYQEYVRQVLALPPAQREAIMTSDEFVGTLDELIPGLEAGTIGLQAYGEETGQVAMRQAEAVETMSDMQEAVENQTNVIGFYTDAIDAVFGPLQALERARDDVRSGVQELSDALDDESRTLDHNTQAGLANRGVIMDQADAILEFAKAQLESGMAIEDVEADYLANIEHLRGTAIAAGLAEDDVNALLETYGMTPENLTTMISVAGDALAKWRVDRFLEKLDEITEEEAVRLEAYIDEGDWAAAEAYVNQITRDRVVRIAVDIWTRSVNVPNLGGFGGNIFGAEGGYVSSPTRYIVGEAGPEVILPLSDPSRMAELIRMPQVMPGILAALGHLNPGHSTGGGAPASSGQASGPIHVHIYNYGKRQLTGQDVTNAFFQAGIR
jgi:plasmid maintenance system antidote protein VapI